MGAMRWTLPFLLGLMLASCGEGRSADAPSRDEAQALQDAAAMVTSSGDASAAEASAEASGK